MFFYITYHISRILWLAPCHGTTPLPHNKPPILIEIFVTHKSTEEKLNSNYRIIEIQIESEEDINQIVSTSSIIESEEKQNNKIRFYNFKADSSIIPKNYHQAYKYLFWIDSTGHFHFDNNSKYYVKCLSINPTEIENSRFRIESKHKIEWDFAFRKLSESGLDIKYCTMCRFYKMNDYYMRKICILYKSKKTQQYPKVSEATNCPHYRKIDYNKYDRIFKPIYTTEYKITIR